jgi:dienelactone hydrolase
MAATVVRPLTNEPRPLAVLNHGTPFFKEMPYLIEPYHRFAAEWFVERGFVVVMPLRRGHGITGGPNAEFTPCRNPDYIKAGIEASRDIQAAIDYMYQQPFVKQGHIVVAGISTGGYSSLGFASLNPKDVKAIINFAGGRSGFVNRVPQATCDAAKLIETAGKFGETARIPTLWIYNENDNFFGPDLARSMHAAFVKGGGIAEFHMLPPFGQDGHVLYGHRDGIRIWSPIVEAFLKRINALPPP